MVDVTFENLYPIAGLIVIAITIWGMSRKFTSMELTQQKHEKDIDQNKHELQQLKADFREMYKEFLILKTKMEDKLK